jgi:DNA sulfur modification protein DndB
MQLRDEFINLITSEKIKKKLKIASRDYVEMSITKSQEQEYVSNGWEILRYYKNTLRIRKEKINDIRFEDRIWSLLANIKFKFLNKDRNFKIQYAKNVPGKQIDVFAADDEVILIVECKSTLTPKKASFQKDINEINGIRKGIVDRIKKHFNGSPKIAWIFCTNNYLVSDNDIARMKEHNIMFLNQNDIRYYEELAKRIGSATKYQLYGRLFAKQKIPNLHNIVPAVMGKMGGYTYYSFSIEPELLLKISYIMHRVQTTDDTLNAYQRMVKSNRIKQIGQFINDGNFFPNAVIINIDTKNGKVLNFDKVIPKKEHSSISQLGLLHLPNYFRSAYVIDGQHRLYGYSESEFKDKNTIPVIAFENLPSEVQSNLFVDINSKQKSVNRNLLSTLDAELRWNSPNKDDAVKALKSKLVQILTEKMDSPLYERIIIGEGKKTSTKCITLAYFCDYGLNKCKFFGEFQKKKLIRLGYLCDGDDLAELTLNKAYDFFKHCFNLVVDVLPTQWNQGELEGGFIAKNIGVSSYVVIINDILDYTCKNSTIIFNAISSKEIYEAVEPMLLIILNKLKKLPKEDVINMAKQYGAGGVDKVRREFQKWLHDREPNFNPDGLQKYIQDSSGMYNKETREVILHLQSSINDFIICILKEEYNNDWWSLGVPHKIQKDCASKHIDEGRKEKEWNYLLLLDYKEIVRTHWKLFNQIFSDPGSEQASKEAKLNWFVKLNKIRNKVMHPERENIIQEEYKLVMEVNNWLHPRLNQDS